MHTLLPEEYKVNLTIWMSHTELRYIIVMLHKKTYKFCYTNKQNAMNMIELPILVLYYVLCERRENYGKHCRGMIYITICIDIESHIKIEIQS